MTLTSLKSGSQVKCRLQTKISSPVLTVSNSAHSAMLSCRVDTVAVVGKYING